LLNEESTKAKVNQKAILLGLTYKRT